MKKLLSVCVVVFILWGIYLYAGKVETVGGWQETSMDPELSRGILTENNVVDAGNHIMAYRVSAADADIVETAYMDYIALCDLDSGGKIFIPDIYGIITGISALTPGEVTIHYFCEEGGKERQICIPIAFDPQESGMLRYAYYQRDRVVAAQETDMEALPITIWSETFEWKGESCETVFERTSPVFGLQLEEGGLFADYCLTVKDGAGNLISRQVVTNYPIEFEEVYWFTDFSGDGIPDVAVCTGIFWGRESWSILDLWIWDGESGSYQGRSLPKEGNPSMPLWDAERSVLLSFGEKDEERVSIVNMYTYAGDQWVPVRSWIPQYGEDLWFDKAKNIRKPDSYRVVDYTDGEVVREEIVAADTVWEEDNIWDRNNERYCQLYPDSEWERGTVITDGIPVDKYLRKEVEKRPYSCVKVEDGYEVVLYGASGEVVFSMEFPIEPGICQVTEDIFEISVSVGSPASYVFWYDTKGARMSETYFNPVLVGNQYVAYMENSEELVLRDLFHEGLLEMKIARDFSQTANYISAVVQIEMADSENIILTYLQGSDYTEVSETIRLENGTSRKDSCLEEWKQAYLDYLEECRIGDSFRYSLIYVDDDDIPELFVDTGAGPGGCMILTFHDHVLDEWQSNRRNVSYIERGNLVLNADGIYGYYFDSVYSIQDGKWVFVGGGEHGDGPAGVQFDENGNYIEFFYWDGEEITEREYGARLSAIYPMEQSIFPQAYYTLDEIRSVIRTGNATSAGRE